VSGAAVPADRSAAMDDRGAAPAGRRTGLERLRTLGVMLAVGIVIAAVPFLLDSSPVGGFTKVDIADGGGARPEVGQKIPDLAGTTVDGQPFSLASLSGKGVWLTFGASWCVDCRAEAPDLEATATAYRGRGLAVVAVFVQEDATAVQSYASRVGFDFTMLPDPAAAIASRFRILGLPTHYFIGPDGVIKEIRLGGLPADQMASLVEEILP
jgi:cytochrome c biogenesis protein CcmG/thiol:disulfide interchange protein DsbE